MGGFEYTHQCHLFFGRAIERRARSSSYAFDEAHMHSMKRGIETMTYWLSAGTEHFPNQTGTRHGARATGTSNSNEKRTCKQPVAPQV